MTSGQIGYAVIDVETTGLRPSWNDRIIEIGVVHADTAGQATGEWSTLVNPERDLGPQRVHGIGSADIRYAPPFKEVAGELLRLLRGRVPVAHNLSFDAGFLQHEFTRIGVAAPPLHEIGICTMAEARRFLPHAPRNLAGCCAMADIPLNGQHDALIDARATTGLLRHFLNLAHPSSPWLDRLHTAARITWPTLEGKGAAWVRRGVSAHRQNHFLARILDRLPQSAQSARAEPYLALLDQALLDHHISAAEADALVEMAASLGLGRSELDRLHRDYLAALANAALADGVVTDDERRELNLVADLLLLPSTAVESALAQAASHSSASMARFELQRGDLIAFTGEMDGGREAWERRASEAGYMPYGNVTKKVRLLVAADPDTLSGKARKARAYGIPIVTPDAFARMLG